jgi:hypothetical protein
MSEFNLSHIEFTPPHLTSVEGNDRPGAVTAREGLPAPDRSRGLATGAGAAAERVLALAGVAPLR